MSSDMKMFFKWYDFLSNSENENLMKYIVRINKIGKKNIGKVHERKILVKNIL